MCYLYVRAHLVCQILFMKSCDSCQRLRVAIFDTENWHDGFIIFRNFRKDGKDVGQKSIK